MKTITVDADAHQILMWAKKETEKIGIERPSHSDAIRWMKKRIESMR